jgi:hypothetical protein
MREIREPVAMKEPYEREYEEPRFKLVSAHDSQIGGSHYTECGIQPADYAMANGFNYYESFALKYLTRHRRKNGAEDIRKSIHCLQLLLEAEYERPDGAGRN